MAEGTAQQQPNGQDARQPHGDQGSVGPDDLDLIDDSLEDAGKSEQDLWNEFDTAEQASTGTDSAEANASADDDAAEAGKEALDEDQGADEAGAAASGGDEAGQQAAELPEGQQGNDANADPWASATPEQRAALEELQSRTRRLEELEGIWRGRAQSLQRQINESQRKAPQGQPSAEAGDAAAAEGNTFLESDDWKSFAQEYPEVAGPIGKLIGTLQTTVSQQQQRLDGFTAERQNDDINQQTVLLAEQIPDWQQLARSSEFPVWLETQPRHIRDAALRNGDAIVDAAEAADVIGRFKAFRSEQAGGNAQQGPSGQQPTANGGAAQPTGQGKTGNALSGKRQRQLESASGARSSGPGAATGIPDDGDPQAIWDAFDREEQRQAAM